MGEPRRDRGRPHRLPRGRASSRGAIPVTLAARLRRSHLLFLGYDLADWNLRLVVSRLRGGRAAPYASWAVRATPSALELAFWRRLDVQAVEVDETAFASLLEGRLDGMARLMSAHAARVPVQGPGAVRADARRRDASSSAASSDVEIVCANVLASRLTGPVRAERRREVVAARGGGRARAARAAGAPGRGDLLDVVGEPGGGTCSGRLRRGGRGAAGVARRRRSQRACEARGDVYLLLDQAEEYFLYHPGGRPARAGARRRCSAAPPRQRPAFAPRGHAREARSFQGVDSRDPRQLPPPRPTHRATRAGRDRASRSQRWEELGGDPVEIEPALAERGARPGRRGADRAGLGGSGRGRRRAVARTRSRRRTSSS